MQVVDVDMPDGIAAQWEGERKLNSDISWLPPQDYSRLLFSSWEYLRMLTHVTLPGMVGPHWEKAI